MTVLRGIAAAGLIALTACSASDVAGNIVGSAVGGDWGEVARATVSGPIEMARQQSMKFSPEQEYYLGRAVAAEAIAKYGLDPNRERQDYVRKIGASIVQLSSRIKGTYGGYHFAVLDSDEANGLSGPGGFVFITRGALVRAESEDEVAAILAHEIAHVTLQHAESVIRKSRQGAAFGKMLLQAAAGAADAGDRTLAQNMPAMLGEMASGFTTDLVESGYGRATELEADREAALILYDVGYDAAAISQYLQASPKRKMGTWSNHPPAEVRVKALEPVLAEYGGPFDGGVGKDARKERFEKLLGG